MASIACVHAVVNAIQNRGCRLQAEHVDVGQCHESETRPGRLGSWLAPGEDDRANKSDIPRAFTHGESTTACGSMSHT